MPATLGHAAGRGGENARTRGSPRASSLGFMDLFGGLLVNWLSSLGIAAFAQLIPQTDFALQDTLQSACRTLDRERSTDFGDTLSTVLARADTLYVFSYALVLASRLNQERKLAENLAKALPPEIDPALAGTDVIAYMARLATILDETVRRRATAPKSALHNWYAVLTREADRVLAEHRHNEIVELLTTEARNGASSQELYLPPRREIVSTPTSDKWLPVPSGETPDVRDVLISGLRDRANPTVVVVRGPHDSGKSALGHQLLAAARAAGLSAEYRDLSTQKWSTKKRTFSQILIIDHIERLLVRRGTELRDAFGTARAVLERDVPQALALGSNYVYIAIDETWAQTFASIYQSRPEWILDAKLLEASVRTHSIRPYSAAETEEICNRIGLQPNAFDTPGLRRAGLLALARRSLEDGHPPTGVRTRALLAARWLDAANDAASRATRRAIWDNMGADVLRSGAFRRSLKRVADPLPSGVSYETVRAQVAEPVRWEGNEVVPASPAWGDVAASIALGDSLMKASDIRAATPLRVSVLDAAVELFDRTELRRCVEDWFEGPRHPSFSKSGYAGPAIGTLLFRLASASTVTLSGVEIQGPDHVTLPRIPIALAVEIQRVLEDTIESHLEELVAELGRIGLLEPSASRGGYAFWMTAREWARRVPIRAHAEAAAYDGLSQDGLWRYEDILDVSITGASTAVLARAHERLLETFKGRPEEMPRYLADVWDGVNDGAWDQIDFAHSDFVSTLRIVGGVKRTVIATDCRLQRAQFDTSSCRGWRFERCDLRLADLRSCADLEDAYFTDTNWWSALLPPPVRYAMSIDCTEPAFLAWASDPPWRNPYWYGTWPDPFSSETV